MKKRTTTRSYEIIKVALRSNCSKFNTKTKRGKKASQNYIKRVYQVMDEDAGNERSFLLDFSIYFVGLGGFGVFEAGEWGILDKSMAEYGLLSIFARSWSSLEVEDSEREGLGGKTSCRVYLEIEKHVNTKSRQPNY